MSSTPPSSATDSRLKRTGTATANYEVEIFDGSTSIGKTTANASGVWTLPITDLTVGAHALKAQLLNGHGEESAVYSFTILALAAPTITSVKDSRGVEIPQGDSTVDTSVTITGTAAANEDIEIFDGAASKGTASTNASGVWTRTLTNQAIGGHAIKAGALYGNEQESAVRTFTIAAPLDFNVSPVALQATLYMIWRNPGAPALPTFPAGSTITHTASGGQPPYTYSSSNDSVANVTSDGLVSPRGNGAATITVRDNTGQSKNYTVTVSNVWTVEYIGSFIHRGAVEYQRPGGHLSDTGELGRIGDQHRGHWPAGIPNGWYWSNERDPGLFEEYWAKSTSDGAVQVFLAATAVDTFSVYPRNP